MNDIVTLFRNRLSNELTRDASLRGLTMVALNLNFDKSNGSVIALNGLDQFTDIFLDLLKKT
jgi:hypothetical protein